jgi:voltage-gated potassium channel
MISDLRLRAGLTVLIAVLIVGTVGFMALEDLSVLDAFYMTAITISTVGFSEVGGDLSSGGKLFTVGVIIFGMGSALYTAAVGAEQGLDRIIGGEGRRRRMDKQISHLKGHIVLCGFGRVGSTAFQQLASTDEAVVVIEIRDDAAAAAREAGALVIEGDATHDDVLEAAGIARAKTLISAVRDDSDNLVITLSAKAQRPDLMVIARVVEPENERKLYMAGADRVVAPQRVGAERLAALALHPDLAEFIDLVVRGRTVEFRVAEYSIPEGAAIVDKSLRELDLRNQVGALVLAVSTPEGAMSLNPDPDLRFRAGSIVVGFGTQEQLDRLGELATGP